MAMGETTNTGLTEKRLFNSRLKGDRKTNTLPQYHGQLYLTFSLYYIITIESMFAGVNMFLARVRLILARAAGNYYSITIISEGIRKEIISSILSDELTKPTRCLQNKHDRMQTENILKNSFCSKMLKRK